MNEKPLVSVIIPTYNTGTYLYRCLDSVVNQTYKNLEIIIIDDASTDDFVTPGIIEKYRDNDPRIHAVFKEKNIGPGAARNFGLKIARGKYVIFMDHDDWQDLDKYAQLVETAEKTGADITCCNGCRSENGRITDIYWPLSRLGEKWYEDDLTVLRDKLLAQQYVPPWAKLVRTDLIRRAHIGFSLNNRFDDVLYHYLCILNADSFAFIEEDVLHFHRFLPQSITGQAAQNPDMYLDILNTWNDLENYARQYKANPEKWLRKVLIRFLFEISQFRFMVSDPKKYHSRCRDLIKKYRIKKKDFPPHLLHYYDFFPKYYWLNKLKRRKEFSIRIRIIRGEYQLILFSKTIFRVRTKGGIRRAEKNYRKQ